MAFSRHQYSFIFIHLQSLSLVFTLQACFPQPLQTLFCILNPLVFLISLLFIVQDYSRLDLLKCGVHLSQCSPWLSASCQHIHSTSLAAAMSFLFQFILITFLCCLLYPYPLCQILIIFLSPLLSFLLLPSDKYKCISSYDVCILLNLLFISKLLRLNNPVPQSLFYESSHTSSKLLR